MGDLGVVIIGGLVSGWTEGRRGRASAKDFPISRRKHSLALMILVPASLGPPLIHHKIEGHHRGVRSFNPPLITMQALTDNCR